jgi:hypothetical protein
MVDRSASRRSDEELTAMLDERADWSVKGRRQVVFSKANSLRDALMQSLLVRDEGRVMTISRGSSEDIILFHEQIKGLVRQIGRVRRKKSRQPRE